MSDLVDVHKPLYNAEFDIVRIYLMPGKSCCIKVLLYLAERLGYIDKAFVFLSESDSRSIFCYRHRNF